MRLRRLCTTTVELLPFLLSRSLGSSDTKPRMKKMFIGGSRRLTHLSEDVRQRLDSIVQRELTVLIGDANGADRAVQLYLHRIGYRNVQVFCVGDRCRNNVGGWETRAVPPPSRAKNLDYFAAKDRQMAREADAGLMLWDGKSAGTVLNAARLVAGGKQTAIYEAPRQRFVEIVSQSGVESLLDACSALLREKVESQLHAEGKHIQADSQAQLL